MGSEQSTSEMAVAPPPVSLSRVHSRPGLKLKLLIRGERGSGKTLLCNHLKGLSVFDTSPTKEIETTTINWLNNKDNNDQISIEVHLRVTSSILITSIC